MEDEKVSHAVLEKPGYVLLAFLTILLFPYYVARSKVSVDILLVRLALEDGEERAPAI